MTRRTKVPWRPCLPKYWQDDNCWPHHDCMLLSSLIKTMFNVCCSFRRQNNLMARWQSLTLPWLNVFIINDTNDVQYFLLFQEAKEFNCMMTIVDVTMIECFYHHWYSIQYVCCCFNVQCFLLFQEAKERKREIREAEESACYSVLSTGTPRFHF